MTDQFQPHEVAAQVWCDDRVSDRTMDPDLCLVFAETLAQERNAAVLREAELMLQLGKAMADRANLARRLSAAEVAVTEHMSGSRRAIQNAAADQFVEKVQDLATNRASYEPDPDEDPLRRVRQINDDRRRLLCRLADYRIVDPKTGEPADHQELAVRCAADATWGTKTPLREES